MSYTIAPLDFERDRDDLIGLWCENFKDPRDKAVTNFGFSWLYERNPPTLVRTWVAFEHDGPPVVGCATAFRANRYVEGQLVGAAVATAMAVTKKHRTLAAALGLAKAVMAGSAEMGAVALLSNPTQRALPICVRVGYDAVGETQKWKLRLSSTSPAGCAAMPPADFELVDTADERFDRLWERASRHHPVLGDKSSTFLNWHNAQLSLVDYQYFSLVNEQSREIWGYVGFYRNDAGAFITDILAETQEASMLELLLHRFVQWAQAQKLSWIGLRYFGTSHFEESLLHLGFVRKEEGGDPVVVHLATNVSVQAKAALLDKRQWFSCGGDFGA